MFLSQKFPILIAHGEVGAPSVAGTRLKQLQQELEQNGWKTIAVNNAADAQIIAGAHRGLSAILFSVGARRARSGEAQAHRRPAQSRPRARPRPADHRDRRARHGRARPRPPLVEALRELHSILYLYEDTVPFLARQVMRAASDYLDNLLPPFFKALVHHAERSAYSWHTPGHAGGVGFTKSAVGFALHEFFGENTLRSDLSISVPELGLAPRPHRPGQGRRGVRGAGCSAPTTPTSSPTAPRPPTRSSGTRWPGATTW